MTDSPTATDTATPTEATTTDTATATDSPTPTDSPTATATDSPTATATDTPTPQAELTVSVGPDGNFRFDPEEFTIAVGETVRWVWASPGHNVSPASQPSGAEWPGRDESTYDAGTTHSYTFEVAGTYEYHCDPHQSVGMVGSFTVE
jgi:plastocyanin